MAHEILVIIVTYNAMPWAKRCFDSLLSSNLKVDTFVVDNGSSDGTQQFIQQNYPNVIFKQCEINLGFGQANNIGLKYAVEHNYDYVYLLNQDAWIFNDTIENMILCHQENPQYGILSPMQVCANMDSLDICFRECTCKNLPTFVEDLFFDRMQILYEVDKVMAAHWLISIDCVKRIGGFSPTFYLYGEDDNYIDRVHFHGLKVGIVTSAKAVHDRKDRVWTKDQNLSFYFYKYYLALFSEPRHVYVSEWIKMIYISIINAIKNRSLKLLKDTFKLVFNSGQIRTNRIRSMKNAAFL